jgi:hypothetical protein
MMSDPDKWGGPAQLLRESVAEYIVHPEEETQ